MNFSTAIRTLATSSRILRDTGHKRYILLNIVAVKKINLVESKFSEFKKK